MLHLVMHNAGTLMPFCCFPTSCQNMEPDRGVLEDHILAYVPLFVKFWDPKTSGPMFNKRWEGLLFAELGVFFALNTSVAALEYATQSHRTPGCP